MKTATAIAGTQTALAFRGRARYVSFMRRWSVSLGSLSSVCASALGAMAFVALLGAGSVAGCGTSTTTAATDSSVEAAVDSGPPPFSCPDGAVDPEADVYAPCPASTPAAGAHCDQCGHYHSCLYPLTGCQPDDYECISGSWFLGHRSCTAGNGGCPATKPAEGTACGDLHGVLVCDFGGGVTLSCSTEGLWIAPKP